ncbi:MAG: hypothetical protein U9Q12_01915 [Patescibacteria group bacterium]|nr:hypothetical protein [Patescibacteria group bacterium]
MVDGPTFVGTLLLESGDYCVAIINLAAHIDIDNITIVQARSHGLLIEKIGHDVRISPMWEKWDEKKALKKRDVIEHCLITNGFYKLFESCNTPVQ